MTTIDLYLSLGSNLGERKRNLDEALMRLDDAFGTHWASLSGIIETKAWGFAGEDFLNCAVRYSLPKAENAEEQALAVLDQIKRIESEMGRSEPPEYGSDGRRVYHSRVIDIDILLFGNEIIDHPRLKVPHPLMNERDFVMIPLKEILTESPKNHYICEINNL